tara:strand:+ start:5340 stop:5630 length:291 start_codon:yes stop_codon:yes gene_type:complete
MVAFWIARAKVKDINSYKKYADQAGHIVESYGGKFLARGGNFKIMEGSDHYTRFVIAQFPNMDKATECFKSEEYKAAASFRRNGAGDVEIIFVEGS